MSHVVSAQNTSACDPMRFAVHATNEPPFRWIAALGSASQQHTATQCTSDIVQQDTNRLPVEGEVPRHLLGLLVPESDTVWGKWCQVDILKVTRC